MSQEGKIIFPFDGGVMGGAMPDIVQPPAFVESVNTRLSVERGAPTKAPITEYSPAIIIASSPRCTGVLPHPASGSVLYCNDQPVRLYGTGQASYVQRADGSGNTHVRTLQVVESGSTMPGRSFAVPSIALADDGAVWTAQVKQKEVRSASLVTFDGTVSVYVSYRDAAGNDVAVNVRAADLVSGVNGILYNPHHCSITAHADYAVLWTADVSSGTSTVVLYARRITVVGGALSIGAPVGIIASTASQACWNPGIIGKGEVAWAAMTTTNANVQVARINTATLSPLNVLNIATSGLEQACCSIALDNDNPALMVVAAIGSTLPGLTASSDSHWVIDNRTGSMNVVDSDTRVGSLGVGQVCAVIMDGYYGRAVCAGGLSTPLGVVTVAARTGTNVRAKSLVSGAIAESWADGMRLASLYAAQDVFPRPPIVALTPWYGPYADQLDKQYVTDPAAILVALAVREGATVRAVEFHPVGRVAVDRIASTVCAAQNTTFPAYAFMGASMQMNGSRFALTYLDRDEFAGKLGTGGLPGRYVMFDAGSFQPPVSQVADSFAVAGGSLSVCWDGYEFGEYMPLNTPAAFVSTNAPGSNVTGQWSYMAVCSWKDASGRLHRSAPSRAVSVNLTAAPHPDILVTRPMSAHTGHICSDMVVRLYCASGSGTGSSLFKLVDIIMDPAPVNGHFRFPGSGLGATPPADAPAIFTDYLKGSELAPVPPPPSQDMVMALDRLFVIDAENRSDVWFTKPLTPGVVPEFSSSLRVTFPAQAGQLVALAEIGGQLVALGERGVAALYGDGPDANGYGGFGPPRLVSKIGCTQRTSVARYQGGVLFQSYGRWARMTAQGAEIMEWAPRIQGDVRAATVIEGGSEIAFWLDTGAVVWNYERQLWTTWTARELPTGFGSSAVTIAAENMNGSEVWLARLVDGGLIFPARLTSDSPSVIAQMGWVTGWIVPPGDQQLDVEWEQVLIHALSEGSHGVVVQIRSDYDNDGGTTVQNVVYTAADIATATDAYSNRYTLPIDVVNRKARSLRISVAETNAAGQAMRPISCTIHYQVAGKQARRPFQPIAHRS